MHDRSRLDPYVEALAQRFAEDTGVDVELPASRRPPAPTDPVARREHMRLRDAEIARAMGVERPRVAVEDHTIPTAGHPDARLRVYWPTAERPTPRTAHRLPMFVYFFGGSFTMGGIDWASLDTSYRVRAAEAGVIVIAGEYSLAPEVTYPAQPEQCWSVFEWALSHADDLGGDASRIAVGGASAGGNLAAAVTLMNRDRNDHAVRLQILEVPALDLTGRHIDARAISRVIPAAVLRRVSRPIVRDYLGARHLRTRARDAYASPLLAPDHSGLPPALIVTAERDPLRGDGESYARTLAASGVPATCVRYLGQDHGSGGVRHLNPAADHVHRQIISTLRTLHEPAADYRAPWATNPR